ncbi:MAG: hypothetical protein HY744_07730 [Deltaproteobacteria bacterium]|nr:hypothetical protein [Deltaproteobacteria bacterium]
MAPAADLDTSADVAGPLGTLALSPVRPHSPTATLRAVKWHQDLDRLGLDLPFAVVHDFGLVLCSGAEQVSFAPRCDPALLGDAALYAGQEGDLLTAYAGLLREARQSEAARRALRLQMGDDLVVVVLARLLGEVARRITCPPAYRARLPLGGSLFERLDPPQLARLYRAVDRSFEREALRALGEARLLVLTLIDALDLDTLRLFGMLGAAETGPLGQIELLCSLETPEANDVVNFSLQILPSVLETKGVPAAGTSAGSGYSGLGRRGSIDSLVLTELAWDDLELGRRIADCEVLYYSREQSREQQRRRHLLLVDASASMRGERATFARALALATGKKLLLAGEDVVFRFFDARLYEAHAARQGELPTAHILSFRGERGRNPRRVFTELCAALEIARRRDGRPVLVHLFTHAALYVPRELVQQVRALGQIAAVFILPSGGKLDLDYLDLLAAKWVVDHGSLGAVEERARAAHRILGVAGAAAPAHAAASAGRAA